MKCNKKNINTALDELYKSKDVSRAAYSTLKFLISNIDTHSTLFCRITDCFEPISKNSSCYCVEHAYQHKMEGY